MIVVSDTSPLTALLSVGEEALLRKIFGEVIIPEAVHAELLISHPVIPEWIVAKAVVQESEARRFATFLDQGEAEAIELAKELHADMLLIDERKGRLIAMREGVPVIGLLGVILLAKRKGILTSVRDLLQRLDTEAGFYLSSELRAEALRSVGEQ